MQVQILLSAPKGETMNLVDIIKNDPKVLEKYQAIDKVNAYPFNHGMKHINNVIALVDKIAPLFDLSEREIEILKICEILHDLGQVEGREKHGLRASTFAKDYLANLPGGGISQAEISDICSAILTHDEKHDYSKLENKYSWFVNLIDKMDFAKNRLEDDYLDRFGYIEYNDIERLSFDKKGKRFIITIHTIVEPKIISEEILFARDFFNKVVNTARHFCQHFNLTLEMYLDKQKLNLSKLNCSLI